MKFNEEILDRDGLLRHGLRIRYRSMVLHEVVWASRPTPDVLRLERDNGGIMEQDGRRYFLKGIEPRAHNPWDDLMEETRRQIDEEVFKEIDKAMHQ